MAYGLGQESDGWKIGGFLGGFFGMSAGVTLTTFGFILDYEPMSDAEKRSAAEVYNRDLRKTLNLDSEVNVPRPKRSGGLWPFSGIPATPSASIRVSF